MEKQHGGMVERPCLSVIFSILHKQQCFNWFIVLVLVVYYEDTSLKCNGNGSLSEQLYTRLDSD